MKKSIGIVAMIMILSTAAFAQRERATPEKQIKQQVANMQKELMLNDEQASKMTKLMTEQASKQKALAEQMKANREASKAEIKSILTQEQYIQLLEKKAERGPRMRHQMRMRQDGGRKGGMQRG
jgi:septal ring factor EnvC (AmiA/AmiB activator)